MGSWNTLHVFDDKKFHNDVIPILKGKKEGLLPLFHRFMSFHITGSIYHWDSKTLDYELKKRTDEIIEIASGFDDEFINHKIFSKINNYEDSLEISGSEKMYHFARFFEFIVFELCADYYPYLYGGKTNVANLITVDWKNSKSIAVDILSKMSNPNPHFVSFFYSDGGIIGWSTFEEILLLFYDIDKLEHNYGDVATVQFKAFIKFVISNELGLITGKDLMMYEQCKQFKFNLNEKWLELKTDKINVAFE